MNPNFFKYATNELSQDAFFCWLIEWSLVDNKSINPTLHNASLKFLNYVIPKEFSYNLIVNSCSIQMQKKNMDFIIILNSSIVIHFEDKIKSNTSTNQLSKYKETVATLFQNHRLFHIYLKTDLVWPNEERLVLENGYKLIDLIAIERILESDVSSDIYQNYVSNIKQRLNEYQAYRIISPKNWRYNQWLGFIYDLSKNTNYHNFDKHYVGEAFWFVFSWHKINNFGNSYVSFEIVNKKCAIKAHVFDNNTNKAVFLKYVKEKLFPYYKDYKTKLYKKTAKSMLVIEFFDFLVLENDLIDFGKTKEKLIDIRDIFDKTINYVG